MFKKILVSLSLLITVCSSVYSLDANAGGYIKGRNMLTDFALISTIVGNPSFIQDATGADYYPSRRDAAHSDDCVFSYRNHFYWKKDGKIFDSYRMKWQRAGSANLCQTFALLGYSGHTSGLGNGSEFYLRNAKIALDYWKDHAELILAYWDGTVEVIGENQPENAYEFSVFSACKKPTLANLRNMIRQMASSEDNLLYLMANEQIE